jgi:hypothetical protein
MRRKSGLQNVTFNIEESKGPSGHKGDSKAQPKEGVELGTPE